ncbi:MAG TPA: hypothetical protein VIB00_12045, partial [Pyrinomonadaceae bacterium]
VEQCALARPGRPHEREELAVADLERDVLEHRDGLGAPLVGLAEVLYGDDVLAAGLLCHGSRL